MYNSLGDSFIHFSRWVTVGSQTLEKFKNNRGKIGNIGKLVELSTKMHIYPSSPNSSPHSSEEDAATKIQAGFRGYRVRKQMKQTRDGDKGKKSSGSLEDKSATKIQANVRGFLVRKKQKIATDAATKIQAGFRGFKTRKELHANHSPTSDQDKVEANWFRDLIPFLRTATNKPNWTFSFKWFFVAEWTIYLWKLFCEWKSANF